ncbi:DUF1202 family protein [Escherichia coli]
MTREEAFKKIHQQRDEFNKQNDSEAFAVKYDKEVYQPAIAACHKQSEECYEVREFSRNEISISTNNGDRLFCNRKN